MYIMVVVVLNQGTVGCCRLPIGSQVAAGLTPRSQASSRGETKDLSLFSSRDGYFLEPTVLAPVPRSLVGYSPWGRKELDMLPH